MGIIVYNSKSSKDYSILVEHPPGYEYPEKDLEITHVPGRNGDVIYDTGSYQNVDRKYEIAFSSIKEKYEVVANRVSEWLHSARTYARLEDTYEPEYYRLALYKESNALECIYRGGGRATVTFNCKPQRFLKTGERPIQMNTNQKTIINPTGFEAKPIIHVNATADSIININNINIKIKEACNNLVIDCDRQDCYQDLNGVIVNKNSIVELPKFPTLNSGANLITSNTTLNNFYIIPNWWTL